MLDVRPVIITSCTLRKRADGSAPLCISSLRARGIGELAAAWTRTMACAPDRRPVERLYMGRTFSDSLRVTSRLNGRLFVVSAGLGLVEATEDAPAYEATIAAKDSHLSQVLRRYEQVTSTWWRELGKCRGEEFPISSLVRNSRTATFFVALPSAYLRMVAEDLSRLSVRHATRLRIFTSKPGAASVPAPLRGSVLPYDDRLEGTSRPGTRTDFAQRAMRHFVEDLNGSSHDLASAHDLVRASLERLKAKEVPLRNKRSDEEILQLLRENWFRFGGSSGRLLRYLRDDALVACEQGRFRKLWLELRESEDAVHA
jgi:hypothetical protein